MRSSGDLGTIFDTVIHLLITINCFLAACSLVKCPYHGICSALKNGHVKCSCISSCPRSDKPVCDDAGRTHANDCAFKKRVCEKKEPYKIVHKGRCGMS